LAANHSGGTHITSLDEISFQRKMFSAFLSDSVFPIVQSEKNMFISLTHCVWPVSWMDPLAFSQWSCWFYTRWLFTPLQWLELECFSKIDGECINYRLQGIFKRNRM